ncbi:MAG: cytochrome c oxidase assembly factor Coa1 family protein [Phycisphaeraceae bacterium]
MTSDKSDNTDHHTPETAVNAPEQKLPFFPKRKKFLIPVAILLMALVIGLPVGVWMGSSAVKSSEAFELTLAELKASELVDQTLGQPLEVGTLARGSHDQRNGTYELTFRVTGPIDTAVVRSWCVSEAEGEPWQIEHLAYGIGGRDGREITLIGDPKNPPWTTGE